MTLRPEQKHDVVFEIILKDTHTDDGEPAQVDGGSAICPEDINRKWDET